MNRLIHTLSKSYDVPVGIVDPHPAFLQCTGTYCFFCGSRNVVVARYGMICLVLLHPEVIPKTGISRIHVFILFSLIAASHASVFIPLVYPWLLSKKNFLVHHHIFKERGLQLSNRSPQFATMSSLLKLKPQLTGIRSARIGCCVVYTRIAFQVNGPK